MAITKVAPIKQELTLPKFELGGALILSKLYRFAIQSFKWDNTKFTSWCDLEIVLAWIRGNSSRWMISVDNRLSQNHNK